MKGAVHAGQKGFDQFLLTEVDDSSTINTRQQYGGQPSVAEISSSSGHNNYAAADDFYAKQRGQLRTPVSDREREREMGKDSERKEPVRSRTNSSFDSAEMIQVDAGSFKPRAYPSGIRVLDINGQSSIFTALEQQLPVIPQILAEMKICVNLICRKGGGGQHPGASSILLRQRQGATHACGSAA